MGNLSFLFSLSFFIERFTLPRFSIHFFLNTVNYIEKQKEIQAEFKKDNLNKSFCGVQGRFFQKEPLAAGGKKSNLMAVQ
jgi:hypothetical protein